MNEQITILLIEDNRADARLIQEALLETTRETPEVALFKLSITDRLAEGLRILARGKVDVVLLDLSLPDSEGLNTLLAISKKAPALPVIVMTGLDDQAVTVGALQAGAQDYLVKGEFDRNLLTRAIRYAIQRKREKMPCAPRKILAREPEAAPNAERDVGAKSRRTDAGGAQACLRTDAGRTTRTAPDFSHLAR